MTPALSRVFHLPPFLSRNVSLRSRKRMDLVTIMRGRSSPSTRGRTTGDVTDVIFSSPRSQKPAGRLGAGRGSRGGGRRRGGEGENNLKAELNFSSSESFVRALGGGQWLNGDVSRKVDSRERPALYRPSIHPLLLALHRPPLLRKRGSASAQSYIVAKKYILEKKRKRGRERDGERAADPV